MPRNRYDVCRVRVGRGIDLLFCGNSSGTNCRECVICSVAFTHDCNAYIIDVVVVISDPFGSLSGLRNALKYLHNISNDVSSGKVPISSVIIMNARSDASDHRKH